MTRSGTPPVVAVILAGGAGTRLWPLAGATRPKPFLPLLGGKSLFRLTYDRIAPVAGGRGVLVVAGVEHLPWVRRQVPEVSADRTLLEEEGRNTTAAIATAALWIRFGIGEAIMIVLPSDHFIAPAGAFRSALRRAVHAAARTRGLVTIGVPAHLPDTGFGYIRRSGRAIAPGVWRVGAFVEKPDPVRARRMVRSGRYLWNSGIFVWRAGTILEELDRHCPDVLRPLLSWARRCRGRAWRVPRKVLRRVPSIPVDRAVLEKSDRVLVMRAPFRWSDLGNWDALARVLGKDGRGNTGIGRIVAIDSSECLGVNEGGLTVLVGVEGLAVIRSKNVVLVCDRRAAQRVRQAFEQLNEDDRRRPE